MLTAAQLAEWAAYYHLEPFGSDIADMRNALLAWVVASAAGAKLRPDTFALNPSLKSAAAEAEGIAELEAALMAASTPETPD